MLSNFQCQGVLLIWRIVGQGPIALATGAGGGLFGHFFLSSIFPPFSRRARSKKSAKSDFFFSRHGRKIPLISGDSIIIYK